MRSRDQCRCRVTHVYFFFFCSCLFFFNDTATNEIYTLSLHDALPILIITGSGNEEIAVTMMKAGASDYLIKSNLGSSVLEKSIKDSLDKYQAINNTIAGDSPLFKDMAIEASLNGVCITDLNCTITYVNSSFVTMWGYHNEEEIIGKPIDNFLYDCKECADIKMVLGTKKSWIGEMKGKKKDSSLFYLQALLSLIDLKDKGVHQMMFSFIDITRVKDAEEKRESLYKGIMEVFALRAEEVGNAETAGHIHRIASYVRFIADKLRVEEPFKDYIDRKYVSDLSYASMLHDVGKWRTPNEILLKPTDLSAAEWEIIRQHPVLGVEMLTPLLKNKGSNQYLKLVESVVFYHHERWDGKGYPKGLKGEEIPLSARIVALADIYDALTSDRSYRKYLTHEEAVAIMTEEKERFDPRIWKIFMDNIAEFKRIRDSIV